MQGLVTETSDKVRYEVHRVEQPILPTVAAQGGRMETVTIEEGDYQLIVELPPCVDVHRTIKMVADTYPAAEEIAQR